MIDPMANIDPSAPMGPEMDSTGGGGADGNQEVFDMNAYRSNLRKMDKIRSFMGIASGCVAGVCGLTGLSGLGKCHSSCGAASSYLCIAVYFFLAHHFAISRS